MLVCIVVYGRERGIANPVVFGHETADIFIGQLYGAQRPHEFCFAYLPA